MSAPAAPEHAAAQLLYRTRTALRLTQRQLSAAAGIPAGTLSSWETGRTVPTVDRLLEVFATAGVSVELTARTPSHPVTVTIAAETA